MSPAQESCCEKAGALESEAEKGDAKSQFLLARRHIIGQGAAKDPALAWKWMKKSADQGYADAIGGIGYFYSTGMLVDKDDKEAVFWFSKGADGGSAKAKVNLAQMLLFGRGIESDKQRAVQLLEEAAKQNVPEAHGMLADIYLSGEANKGVPEYEKAFLNATKGAEAGLVESENMLGVLLQSGQGTEINLVEAEKWYRKAAKSGEAKAQSNLGQLLDPHNEDAAKRTEAIAWIMIAAEQSEPMADRLMQELSREIPKAQMSKAQKRAEEIKGEISARP